MVNNKRGTTIPAIFPPERLEPDLLAVSVSGFLMVEVKGWRNSEDQADAQVHDSGVELLASR